MTTSIVNCEFLLCSWIEVCSKCPYIAYIVQNRGFFEDIFKNDSGNACGHINVLAKGALSISVFIKDDNIISFVEWNVKIGLRKSSRTRNNGVNIIVSNSCCLAL